MGDVVDDTVDILAEPDEPSHGFFSTVLTLLQSYGWYIIAAAIAIYFYLKNRLPTSSSSAGSPRSKSPEELQNWRTKEEQRLKAVQRLQEKYSQDAAIKEERQKELDEQKRKAKLEEIEKLAGKVDLKHKSDGGDKPSTSKSLRSEYNPLMGDASSSGRVCFRRPGGGGGGG